MELFRCLYKTHNQSQPIFLQLGYTSGYGSAMCNYILLLIFCYLGENLKQTVSYNDLKFGLQLHFEWIFSEWSCCKRTYEYAMVLTLAFLPKRINQWSPLDAKRTSSHHRSICWIELWNCNGCKRLSFDDRCLHLQIIIRNSFPFSWLDESINLPCCSSSFSSRKIFISFARCSL